MDEKEERPEPSAEDSRPQADQTAETEGAEREHREQANQGSARPRDEVTGEGTGARAGEYS